MNPTTEHTESTEPAAWRSRWYSAAKRFGLTVAAIVGATNIRPIGRDGPRWWTPSDAPLQAGKLAFRDPEEAARANCEVAVHALPDGSRALYVFWFTD